MDNLISSFDTNTSKPNYVDKSTKISFYVSPQSKEKFWDTYLEDISSGKTLHISECYAKNENRSLSISMSFKFEKEEIAKLDQKYTEALDILVQSVDEYVEVFIYYCYEVLSKYCEISNDQAENRCVYMRRLGGPVKMVDDKCILESTLVFPYCKTTLSQCNILFHRIVAIIHMNHPTSKLPARCIDDPFSLTDESNRFLYGSCDPSHTEAQMMIKVFSFDGTDSAIEINLESAFNPTLHPDFSLVQDDEKDLVYYLPLFLSKEFAPTRNLIIRSEHKTLVSSDSERLSEFEERDQEVQEPSDDEKTMKTAAAYMRMINPKRALEGWSWEDITAALYSLPNKEEAYLMYKKFSSYDKKKQSSECDLRWAACEYIQGISIDTLRYFAYLDNKREYDSFCKKKRDELIRQAYEGQTHIRTANAFRECFPFEFLCSSHKGNAWYYFNGTRWAKMDGESKIIEYLTRNFISIVNGYRMSLVGKVGSRMRDEDIKKDSEKTIALIGKFIQKIETKGFHTAVASCLRTNYHNPRFEELRDSSQFVTGVVNGIVDVREGKPILRQGKPEDYVTLNTRTPLNLTMNFESSPVKKWLEYLRKVFPDEGVRKYMRLFIASRLRSGNKDKVWPILEGVGYNSKSIFVRILETAFGNYVKKISTAFMTEKRPPSGAPQPDLVRAHGARMVIAQEPDGNSQIRAGNVKELTGNDTTAVRDLFEKGSDIIEKMVTYVLMLVCNSSPKIDENQKAIWERIRKILFESEWVDPRLAPQDEKEQFEKKIFKMDTDFEKEIVELSHGCLWLAFYDYEDYHLHGLPLVEKIQRESDIYRTKNNIYLYFKNESIAEVKNAEGVRDETVCTPTKKLYAMFRKWYLGKFSNTVPDINAFKDNLAILLKRKVPENDIWTGIEIIAQEEEFSGPRVGSSYGAPAHSEMF